MTRQQLTALDDVENSREALFPPRIRDDQTTVATEHSIARRPVASSTQLEGHPSSLSAELSIGEVPVIMSQHATSSSSTGIEQDNSVLKVTDFEGHLAPGAQHERNSIFRKPTMNADRSTVMERAPSSEFLDSLHKEWIPFMLRKTGAFSLAVVLFMLVGLLEFLDRLKKIR